MHAQCDKGSAMARLVGQVVIMFMSSGFSSACDASELPVQFVIGNGDTFTELRKEDSYVSFDGRAFAVDAYLGDGRCRYTVDIWLRDGNGGRVELTVDSNLAPLVRTAVVDGVLTFHLGRRIDPKVPMHLVLSLPKAFSARMTPCTSLHLTSPP